MMIPDTTIATLYCKCREISFLLRLKGNVVTKDAVHRTVLFLYF